MQIVRMAVTGVVWGAILVAGASAQPILDRVEKFVRDSVDATKSVQPAEPGYLGLLGDDAADAGGGVRVMEVYPGHAAAQGGLRKGDLITRIDQQPVRVMDDMARALQGKLAGTKLAITVDRDGTPQTLNVTLGRRQRAGASDEELPAPEGAAQPAEAPRPRLGVRSIPVTDPVRRQNGLDAARGAHVISVIVDSAAQRAGIPLGAVITAVDKRPVNTPEELAAAISSAKTNPVELTYVARGQTVRRNVTLAGVVPADQPKREVRGRPPLPEAPGPSDAAPPETAPPDASEATPPVVENPAQQRDDRVTKLERRLQELEARIKTLEAELARHNASNKDVN